MEKERYLSDYELEDFLIKNMDRFFMKGWKCCILYYAEGKRKSRVKSIEFAKEYKHKTFVHEINVIIGPENYNLLREFNFPGVICNFLDALSKKIYRQNKDLFNLVFDVSYIRKNIERMAKESNNEKIQNR